ncbi:MAG: MurR/RpiR family transcriptional regulator [Collinsella sp.]|nr:MurR/RpiR family transcriptional regulator [Collinsella sp.]
MAILDRLERGRDLTAAERSLAAYILAHADEVVGLSIGDLAERAFSSNATIIRLCRKLGTAGYRGFRIDLAADLERRRQVSSDIDADRPFSADAAPAEIAGRMAALSKEAVDASYAALDPELLMRAARLIRRAGRLYLFAIGDSQISVLSFANLLMKLGVHAVVANQFGDTLAAAHAMAPGDAALFVSYSGKIVLDPDAAELFHLIRSRSCRTIWVSAADAPVGVDCALLFPHREDDRDKMATFYSQACIRYLLNCLYGMVWSLDYEGSARRKFEVDAATGAVGQ